ncbi:MAG: FAD-dependent oxidoreductase [Bacillota bacterium]|nr:FAD-dependent oxidoreductase [Bacillota bacterium]
MKKTKEKIKLSLREIKQETSDVYSFFFDIQGDFDWIAGQHGIFRFVNRKIKDEKEFRIFSFASIKEENMMLFSTRIVDTPSDFKKNLLELIPGDLMTIDSAMGKFILEDYSRPNCIIAGGVGITPIRSFIKQLDSLEINPKNMEVLYCDDRGEFAYEETFKEIDNKYDGLNILFIIERDSLNQKIDSFVANNKNDANYYISGAPGMVDFITDRLIDSGIEKTNIKTDLFLGY